MPWNKVCVPQSFQVLNYAIPPAYLDISVLQQWVKWSVLLIPAPCQTWLHLEWQSWQYSKRIFCPLSPRHILWQTTHIDFGVESIQFLFRFYIYTRFSISSHRMVSFVQWGVMTQWWIGRWDQCKTSHVIFLDFGVRYQLFFNSFKWGERNKASKHLSIKIYIIKVS